MYHNHSNSDAGYTPAFSPRLFSSSDSSDFDYIDQMTAPRRRLSDSEKLITTTRFSSSLTDRVSNHLELFLPKSVIDEITVKDSSPQTNPTIEVFENQLTEGNYDSAIQILDELILSTPDQREKGKLLRAAAESAKRVGELQVARSIYRQCTTTDPTTSTSWIDRAKLLDEIGEVSLADEVLKEGVSKVFHPDQLIRKILKSYERMNLFDPARSYLYHLFSKGSNDRESILIEGGLFELRQGHIKDAMVLFNYAKSQNSWKPTVYSELVQFFERAGIISQNFSIVHEGIEHNPRNSALFLILLKYQKSSAKAIELLRANSPKWTAEFRDKMTTALCETLAVRHQLQLTRELLGEQISICSSRQRYKLLLAAASTELAHGNRAVAPLLLDLALKQAPSKSRPIILVFEAKVFELGKMYSKAQEIYDRAIKDFATEWRVFIEYAFFLIHQKQIQKAIDVLELALTNHNGSGRLWAFRVQLQAFISAESQIQVLQKAIQSVPKSGEVWCEAARIALNPLTEYFNLEAAKQYLDFAARFTPQHGDSMVELIRVEMLRRGVDADLSDVLNKFVSSEGNYGLLFLFVRPNEEASMTEVFQNAVKIVREDLLANADVYQRAIARSSFVVRSVCEEQDKFQQMKKKYPPGEFAFGLTSVKKAHLDPSSCNDHNQLLSVVVGTLLFNQA